MSRRRSIAVAAVGCLIAASAAYFIWLPSWREKQAVAALRTAGARIRFDYELNRERQPGEIENWFRSLFGDGFFGDAETVTFGYAPPATDASAAPLADLPNLRHVSLYGTGVTDRTATRLAHIGTLESVGLINTSLTPAGLRQMSRNRRVGTLSLSGANVTDETLRAIEEWPSLTDLQVVRTNISAKGIESIAAIPTMRRLDLWQAGEIDDECFVILERLQNLETLHVIDAAITDAGVRSCAAWKSLRHLRISGSQITDEGVTHLQGHDSLEYIGFPHSAVENPAILATLPNLQEVDLVKSRVSNAGIESLSQSQSITRLRLQWTELTDESMQRLASLKTLESLEIGPHVTESAARTLHESLPNCTIQLIDANGGYSLTLKAEKPPAQQ